MRMFKSAAWLLLAIGSSSFFLLPAIAIAAETKQENLPVLEEADPSASPPTEAAEDPPDSDEITNQNEENTQFSLPTNEIEINELPDILFADPNPLNVPIIPEEVEIDRSPVITLEQAIELAYRNSQSLQAALLTLEQSAAALDEANAARLPTVSTGAKESFVNKLPTLN